MIFIVGNTKGLGGVQTCHSQLKCAYELSGREVFQVDDVLSFLQSIKIIISGRSISLVLFSGISVLLAPFYISCRKSIFFTHGFYVPHNVYGSCGVLKRSTYDFIVTLSFYFYRWVIPVSPSYVSSLVNSYMVRSTPIVVPWGVSQEFLSSPVPSVKEFDLVFMGRVNKEKLDFNHFLKTVLNIYSLSRSQVRILFLVPRETPYLSEICARLLSSSNCTLTVHESVSDSLAAEFLSRSKYFINCFSWEAFGLTFAQALCCGCILLAPEQVPFFQLLPSRLRKYCLPLDSVLCQDKPLSTYLYEALPPGSEDLIYIRQLFSWKRVVDALDAI